MQDFLHALLEEAKLEASRKTVRNAKPADPAKIKIAKTFANPENWEHTRTVALIHTDSSTLLGNFHEFIHKLCPDARKLVRVTEPCATDGTEWVNGDWYLTREEEAHQDQTQWIRTEEVIAGVTLAEMGLHCPEAVVLVRIEFGGIARVELADVTRFTCPARNTFMMLPKGIDVLPAMSMDSKIALRSELEL